LDTPQTAGISNELGGSSMSNVNVAGATMGDGGAWFYPPNVVQFTPTENTIRIEPDFQATMRVVAVDYDARPIAPRSAVAEVSVLISAVAEP
jgi:hypothetical protein